MGILKFKKMDKVVEIRSLGELLDALVDIQQEDIESTIGLNIKAVTSWLKENYPEQILLETELLKMREEYSAQQIREGLIRELRKLLKKRI